jgi:hypothetical protein
VLPVLGLERIAKGGSDLHAEDHGSPTGIAVLRRETGRVVLLNRQRVHMRRNQTLAPLLACLADDLGCVIPYKRLCSAIGHKSARGPDLHVLRQYIRSLRGMLVAHKAPYVIAVVDNVGYGLCKITENARRASSRLSRFAVDRRPGLSSK